jgi:hypothetical protein
MRPPVVVRSGADVILEFDLNPFQSTNFSEGDRGRLIFHNCWRYRLGATNDEGWYRGQCRFSRTAPAWGEFYEVQGDLKVEASPQDWVVMGSEPESGAKHFLFYFRDETFECDAQDVETMTVA